MKEKRKPGWTFRAAGDREWTEGSLEVEFGDGHGSVGTREWTESSLEVEFKGGYGPVGIWVTVVEAGGGTARVRISKWDARRLARELVALVGKGL